MVKEKLDKETRKAILNSKKMIEEIARADSNEAETRKRIDHIFGAVMGYDMFKHITQEYAIRGSGDTVHCDIAIQIDREESASPDFLVEVKRVNVDLAPKHIKQAASYAIDIGCEWVLVTNSKEWRLYHISFGKPPQTKLVESWDIVNDTPAILAKKFDLIGYKNIKKNGLARLWEKSNVLTPQSIIKIILSEESIRLIRRELKKATEVTVSSEEIVGAVRRMLNEAAVGEMEKIKISLPQKKQRKRVTVSKSNKAKKLEVK